MILSNYIYRTNNILSIQYCTLWPPNKNKHSFWVYSLWSYNSSIELKEDISITSYNQKGLYKHYLNIRYLHLWYANFRNKNYFSMVWLHVVDNLDHISAHLSQATIIDLHKQWQTSKNILIIPLRKLYYITIK